MSKVRPMTQADLPRIAELEQLCFEDARPEESFAFELEENPFSHPLVFEEEGKSSATPYCGSCLNRRSWPISALIPYAAKTAMDRRFCRPASIRQKKRAANVQFGSARVQHASQNAVRKGGLCLSAPLQRLLRQRRRRSGHGYWTVNHKCGRPEESLRLYRFFAF